MVGQAERSGAGAFVVRSAGSFSRLAASMGKSIADEREAAGSLLGELAAARILVPGQDIEDGLERELARERGVVGNLRIGRLEGFVNDVLTADGDATSGETPERRLLRKDDIMALLLAAFDGDTAPPQAVQSYLSIDFEGLEGDDADLSAESRRYQLARELAGRFYQYTLSRPDIPECWSEGRSVFETVEAEPTDHQAETERWQRELWLETVGESGRVTANGAEYLTLPSAVRTLGESASLAERLEGELRGNSLRLFGFAAIGPSFLQALRAFADAGTRVKLYRLEPATGGTNDTAPFDDRVASLRDEWASLQERRERLLEEYADEQVDAGRSGGGADDSSALEELKSRLRQPSGGEGVGEGNIAVPRTGVGRASLTFHGAPGIRREIEVAANHVWRLLGEGDIRPCDVAVAIPRSAWSEYLPRLEMVFPNFGGFPYSLRGRSPRESNRLVRAVERLLEVPAGRFHREEVLSALTHPNVLPEVGGSPERWREWVDELGIVDGGDHRDHRETYVDGDLLNWRQGSRRLALGSFLSRAFADEEWKERVVEGHPDDFDGELEGASQRYRAARVEPGAADEAGAFAAAFRSLIADARWLRSGAADGDGARRRAPLSTWADLLSDYIETYVGPAPDDRNRPEREVRQRRRVTGALEKLGDRAGSDAAPIRYETARMAAADVLEGLVDTESESLVDGVVVGTPGRLRGLPFEHVFVLGMQNEEFPSASRPDDLDLRRAAPTDENVEPSERDRWHFVELLSGAERSFHVSWVDREPTSGEPQPVSPVVTELWRALEVEADEAREGSTGEALTTRHPLWRWDRRGDAFEYLDEVPPSERPAHPDLEPSEERGPNLAPEAVLEAQLEALAERGGPAGNEEWLEEHRRRAAEGRSDVGESDETEDSPLTPVLYPWSVSVRPVEEEREADDYRRMRLSTLVNYLKSPL